MFLEKGLISLYPRVIYQLLRSNRADNLQLHSLLQSTVFRNYDT